jgi:hypothetical protein
MKKSDVTCPAECGRWLSPHRIDFWAGDRGEFRCLVCDHLLETFDGARTVALRLTVQPGRGFCYWSPKAAGLCCSPGSVSCGRQARSGDHPAPQARQALQDRQMTVFVYVNTSKQVGEPDHIKVFANVDAAETWFEENDPEGWRSNMKFWSESDRPPHLHVHRSDRDDVQFAGQ